MRLIFTLISRFAFTEQVGVCIWFMSRCCCLLEWKQQPHNNMSSSCGSAEAFLLQLTSLHDSAWTCRMTELKASAMGDDPPPYMIFLVVFLFFLTGLLGFLVCHLLKKKGYRCRTGDMDDEEEEEKLGGDAGGLSRSVWSGASWDMWDPKKLPLR